MKISIEKNDDINEIEVVIKCSSKHDIKPIISKLEDDEKKLIGKLKEKLHLLSPKDVLYCESVDKKSFIYTRGEVFESSKRLYELELETNLLGFIRISKSAIVNLMEISSIKRSFNSLLELEMSNGEKLIVSRGYAHHLKERLGF